MSLIRFNQLAQALEGHQKKGDIPGFYLIFGDSFLSKDALQELSGFLQGKAKDEFSLETLDGSSVTMGEVIEQVSTFSFFCPKKIVLLKNAVLFQTQSKSDSESSGVSSSDLAILSTFIEKDGVPPNHFLIITSSQINRRLKTYKTLEKHGLIIDCSVTQGLRKADLDEQGRIFKSVADRLLSAAGKTIGRQAFQLLSDLTGVDLELFSQNLEKLIIYAAHNKEITVQHVNAVITRDKKEPVFKLPNAFIDKDAPQALLLLNVLLNDGAHPLQILKIFENRIRKLILIKDCAEKLKNGNKRINLRTISFNGFKQNILPQIIEHDKQTQKAIEEKDLAFTSGKTKKKAGDTSELLLAPNPQNPYPVFQLFQKSENFSYGELKQALIYLSDMEYRLKSSMFDSKSAFESFIMGICRK
ncbi:MAG: DNA polymerase III subunit delta [Desulfobacula sp.]|jgi:DNA polymerase III delta subunit|nr:DNA polymerase III subunit delta [Desulfobacula sp.]